MPSFIKHTIHSNDFILHSNRTVFWEQEKALILSDLHIGKTGHFRKSGIPIPPSVTKEDMQRLVDSIQFFKPKQLIIVGDLFHSIENKEHDWFLKWRKDFPAIDFILVKGNHDIVAEEWYRDANIEVVLHYWQKHDFIFVHHMEDYTASSEAEYIFSGHIHPAVSIKGLGKQSLRFPCFYFTENYAVLPAFGKFTGTYLIEPSKKEKAFAVVNNSVIAV
ncbi:MAG: ligase-associated DNA damage response endonuclease PdeM [Chitinophagaceae bacterium]|nr:ligase-associated DNA damage response endonuclease PdeM [Chitinophagaceae bacterium]